MGGSKAVLQKIQQKIVGNKACRTAYGSSAPAGIADSMLCTDSRFGGPCTGEEALPLSVARRRSLQAFRVGALDVRITNIPVSTHGCPHSRIGSPKSSRSLLRRPQIGDCKVLRWA